MAETTGQPDIHTSELVQAWRCFFCMGEAHFKAMNVFDDNRQRDAYVLDWYRNGMGLVAIEGSPRAILAAVMPDADRLRHDGLCPTCAEPVTVEDMPDALSCREFRISGMCHPCQVRVFADPDDCAECGGSGGGDPPQQCPFCNGSGRGRSEPEED